MAKIAPVQEAITEKIEFINLTEKKVARKGFKPLFVIIPVVVVTLAVTTTVVVRRFRSKSEF